MLFIVLANALAVPHTHTAKKDQQQHQKRNKFKTKRYESQQSKSTTLALDSFSALDVFYNLFIVHLRFGIRQNTEKVREEEREREKTEIEATTTIHLL